MSNVICIDDWLAKSDENNELHPLSLEALEEVEAMTDVDVERYLNEGR